MGLSIALVSFSPNTTAKSADINSNFQQILNATIYYGAQGSNNNPGALMATEDVTITVPAGIAVGKGSGSVPVMRMRPDNRSVDRGICLAGRDDGNVLNGMLIDEEGNTMFLSANPYDMAGNRMLSGSDFSGTGSGFYNTGFNGTPDSVCITPTGSSPQSVSYNSLGSNQLHVFISNNSSFFGLCLNT